MSASTSRATRSGGLAAAVDGRVVGRQQASARRFGLDGLRASRADQLVVGVDLEQRDAAAGTIAG
jgi:hypothetical protein